MKKSLVRFLILIYSFLLFGFIFIGTQTGNSKLFPLNFKNRNGIIKTERSIEDVIKNIKLFQENYEAVNSDVENRKKRFISKTRNSNIPKLNFTYSYPNKNVDTNLFLAYDSVLLSIPKFTRLLVPPLGHNEDCPILKITAFKEYLRFDYNNSFIKQHTYGNVNPDIVYGTKDALFYNVLGVKTLSNLLNLKYNYHLAADDVEKEIKKSILDLENRYVKKQNSEVLNNVIDATQINNFLLTFPSDKPINLKGIENIKNLTICEIPDNKNESLMTLYNLICIRELKKNFDKLNKEFDLLSNLNNPTDFRLGVLSFFLKEDMVNNLDNSTIFKEFKKLYQDKFLDLCFKKQDKLSNDGKYIYDYPLIICIDIIKENMVETINNIKVGGILNNPLDLNFNWGELNSNTTTINPKKIAKKRRLLYDENHDTKSNSESDKYTKKEIFDIFFNDYTNVIVAKSISKNFEEPIDENYKGNFRIRKFLCSDDFLVTTFFCDLRSNTHISINDNAKKDIKLNLKTNKPKIQNSSKNENLYNSNDNSDLKEDFAKIINSSFFINHRILANISSDMVIDKTLQNSTFDELFKYSFFINKSLNSNISFSTDIDKTSEKSVINSGTKELDRNKTIIEKMIKGIISKEQNFKNRDITIKKDNFSEINFTKIDNKDIAISASNIAESEIALIILSILLSKFIRC